MRISESTVQTAAARSSEELDRVQKEKEILLSRQPGILGRGIWSGRPGNSGWGDRVSISSQLEKTVQSEYSGRMVSRSQVWGSETSTHDTFEQTAVVERLMGGVMDAGVSIRSIGTNNAGSRVDLGAGESVVSLEETRVHFEKETMAFASQGKVVTQDGRTIEFSLDVAMERSQLSKTREKTLIHRWQEQVNLVDPLVISLDGKVPQLTNTWFEFDLDNDGETEEISFVSKGSGFLAFDKNQDGKINNGSELFGPGTGNGFKELAQYDSDGNHWIDENDEIFSKLSVWTRDGQGNDKLISLKEAGLGAIFLEAAQGEFSIKGPGNQLKGEVRQSGVFLFENGNVGAVQQIDLAARASEPVSVAESQLSPDPAITSPLAIWEPLLSFGPAAWNTEPPKENPFQALMDELKSLREQLKEIMEKKSEQGMGDNARALSDFQLYELTHLDLGASMKLGRSNRPSLRWG